MKSRVLNIAVLAVGITPMSAICSNASFYVADKEYLKYRLQLVQEAIKDPKLMERLEGASIDEINEMMKLEFEQKLKKYREENGLNENGAKKE